MYVYVYLGGIMAIFEVKFRHLLSVLTLIFCLGCGRAKNQEIQTQSNSNLFSANEGVYLDQVVEAKKEAGEISYSKIKFDEVEYDREKKVMHHWGDKYNCYSKDLNVRGSVLVIKGNTESVEEEFKSKDFDFMTENFKNIKNLTIASGREFCVYDLTVENLGNISSKENTEFLISIGHGVNGVLETQPIKDLGSFSIGPHSFYKFKSPHIVMVDFINCQAGSYEDQWRELFPEHSLFHIKDNDISAQKSLEYLNSEYLKALAVASDSIDCSVLNKYNKAILKKLSVDDKCIKESE